jgi:hypothetical protein
VRRVTTVPYAFEPYIAADPTNPDRLAGVAIAPAAFECDPGAGCPVDTTLATSDDGGDTWRTRRLPETTSGDPVVAYRSDGIPYIAGLTDRFGIFLQRDLPGGEAAGYETLPVPPGVDKPWLTVDRHDGTLYVPYSGPTGERFRVGVLLQRSADGGRTWSPPAVVEHGPVTFEDGENVATIPVGAQVMLGTGEELAVAWVGAPGLQSLETGRAFVWIATSSDGGQTFSEPRRIGDAYGFQTTAFHEGTYYVLYQRGEEQDQELVAARSEDGGRTWSTAVVSGAVPLSFALTPAPGVGVAPDGTLDAVFYAPRERCADPSVLRQTAGGRGRYIDRCTYDVYYTHSRDGARTWSAPVRLNGEPIEGEGFVRFPRSSRPGEYIGMASTDGYAHPIWIAGTHAYTARIRR